MNTAPTPRPMTVSLELQSMEPTRLHGRWLILARVACFTLIVLGLLFFFATPPVYSTQLQTICQTASCATGQLTPETAGILQNLGLSLTGYFTLSPLIYPLNFLIFSVGILILLRSQIYRYLRVSSLVQRQQTKWILFGIIIYVVGSLVAYLPVLVFPSLHLNESSSLYSLVLL